MGAKAPIFLMFTTIGMVTTLMLTMQHYRPQPWY